MKNVIKILIVFSILTVNSQEKHLKKNSSPYDQLEYLIGTWKVEFDQGVAFMTFEWGPNKTYITCTNENVMNGKARSQENFSLIIWDGINEHFAVNTSYTSPGSLLYGHGAMKVENNLISRDLVVDYAEGQYMPFLKKKAGKGGFSMPYIQRWKIVNKDRFYGEFEVFINGKFTDPFNKPKREVWNRIN